MSLLIRTDVTPINAQVELSDPNVRDYPQWETGNEAFVSLPESVAVATQGDDLGRVAVELWHGVLEVNDFEMGEALCEIDFVTSVDEVVVGNSIANELHSVSLKAGVYHLKIYTSPVGKPANKVYFVLN